jgi:hypothetical protein
VATRFTRLAGEVRRLRACVVLFLRAVPRLDAADRLVVLLPARVLVEPRVRAVLFFRAVADVELLLRRELEVLVALRVAGFRAVVLDLAFPRDDFLVVAMDGLHVRMLDSRIDARHGKFRAREQPVHGMSWYRRSFS